MIPISNLTLYIEEGGTVPSTDIYGTGKKVFVNIGSGNVFKLRWDPPSMTNDTVDRYSVVIERYDPTANTYYPVFNKNVGLVNEFYVNADILPVSPAQYQVSAYVIAHGKQGGIITSSIEVRYVCRGSGTYVKVDGYLEDNTYKNYTQPIMKRAVAFTKAAVSNEASARIVDEDGNEVSILDDEGNPVIIEATRLLTGIEWQLVAEGYVKDSEGVWQAVDIKYEVLVDKNGDIITDKDDKAIYVL